LFADAIQGTNAHQSFLQNFPLHREIIEAGKAGQTTVSEN
jgi:hypothetical protein